MDFLPAQSLCVKNVREFFGLCILYEIIRKTYLYQCLERSWMIKTAVTLKRNPLEINIKNISWKYEKKSWELFGSYLLNSTANLSGNGLYWLRYVSDNFQAVTTIFCCIFRTFLFLIISLRIHKHQMPSHFWHIIFLL